MSETETERDKELREIKATIDGSSAKSVVEVLEKHQRDLEEKIAHPVGEIRLEYKEVRIEMKKVLHDIGELNKKVADEISTLRDQISHILNLVIDARFKVGSDEDKKLIAFCHHRMVLRQLTQHMLSSLRTVLRTFNTMRLSCEPVPRRT